MESFSGSGAVLGGTRVWSAIRGRFRQTGDGTLLHSDAAGDGLCGRLEGRPEAEAEVENVQFCPLFLNGNRLSKGPVCRCKARRTNPLGRNGDGGTGRISPSGAVLVFLIPSGHEGAEKPDCAFRENRSSSRDCSRIRGAFSTTRGSININWWKGFNRRAQRGRRWSGREDLRAGGGSDRPGSPSEEPAGNRAVRPQPRGDSNQAEPDFPLGTVLRDVHVPPTRQGSFTP